MTEMPLALAWIVFALGWVVLAGVPLLLVPLARPLLAAIDARRRSTLLFGVAMLPLVSAALVAALTFAPNVGGVLVDAHCHEGVCDAHIPILETSVARAGWIAIVLALATISVLWTIGNRLRRSVAVSNALDSFADHHPHDDFEVIESPERFAYCVGLLSPTILVSRGVLDLPAPQRDAVLAHERAHAERHDNLRRCLAGVSLLPLPRRWRGMLLAELSSANERACDRIAGERLGTPTLAAALTALGSRQPCADTDARCNELGIAHVPLPPFVVVGALVVIYAGCTLLALDAAHHGTELVLAWLG